MTWGQVKILTSPLWVNGGKLKSFPTHQKGVILSGSCALRPFIWMMTQGQVLTSDPSKVVWGHRGHQQIFADNLRLRRARDMKVVSVCLSRQYASTDMQLGSRRDLDLRSNFDLDLSSHAIYVSMRLDDANTMVSKSLLYHFKHRSYHWKTVSLKNAVFDLSWPLTLKRLSLGEIWRHLSERAFQELSFAFLDLA